MNFKVWDSSFEEKNPLQYIANPLLLNISKMRYLKRVHPLHPHAHLLCHGESFLYRISNPNLVL